MLLYKKKCLEHFYSLRGGGGGEEGRPTSDLKWATEETLRLVSLYFFRTMEGWGRGVAVASDFPSVVLLLRSGQAVLLKIIQTIHLIGYAVLSVVVKAVSYYFWGSTKIIRERERT